MSLAQDAYPDLDLQGVLAEIDELVVRVRRRMPDDADVKQKVGVLNRFFFRELGFTSNLNDYYDPDNSHLNVVLKRRRGHSDFAGGACIWKWPSSSAFRCAACRFRDISCCA